MKKIILNLLIVLGTLLLFDQIGGRIFKQFIFEKTLSGESGGTINYLISKKQKVNYLILGTSRAKYQIDPSLLTSMSGNGFNAGIGGNGEVIYNNILLDILITEKVIPQTILLQLDAVNFLQSQTTNDQNEIKVFYPFYKKYNKLDDYISSLGYEEKIKLNSRLYRFNSQLIPIVSNYFKRNDVLDYNGFLPLNEIFDSSKDKRSVNLFKDTAFDLKKINALKSISKICAVHNIKLIVVIPPSYKNVFYNANVNNQLTSIIKQFGDHHIINMADINLFPQLQNANKWKDATHLNAEGAKVFSMLLNGKLKDLK